MANLSGQTIQSTYPGLLNLNTATTGITSTPQAITDGLGNDTGAKIAQNYFAAPNILNFYSQFKPDFGGIGWGAGSSANAANSQNRLIYGVFWDSGVNAYKGINYNLVSATTSSDVVTFSIYTAQMVPNYGIAPKDLIVSGISMVSSGATGYRTTLAPSNFSMSGYGGGGFYIYAFVISNAGVTPTVRYGIRTATAGVYSNIDSLGFFLNNTQTGLQPAARNPITAQPNVLNTVQSSYTSNDIITNWANVAPSNWGFGLVTVF